MSDVEGFAVCQQCKRNNFKAEEKASSDATKLQAAPLRQDKLPARPRDQRQAAAAARAATAAQAAGSRRRGKDHGSEDAPITIDSDDEQEQQQQQQPGAAAGDVEHMTVSSDGEGPSGGGSRRRRSSRINLLDPEPGTAAKFAGLHMVYPPEGGKGAVVVSPDDLARLDSGEFLNDTIIDFYIKWIELQVLAAAPEAVRARFHFFNSFFYKKLSEKGSGPAVRDRLEKARRAHSRVKTWTKGVDIFSKDFLLVPIHDALHWSLAIVCHPGLVAQRMQQAAEQQRQQQQVPASEAAGAAALARAAGGGGGAAPAAAAGADAGAPVAAEGADAGVAGAAGTGVQAQPVILHLDSMQGGHSSSAIAGYLRSYLEQEWLAQQCRKQAAAAEAAESSAAAAGRESSPAQQQAELPEPPCAVDAKLLPHCTVSALPKQDNHCDCGLFVLAYMEYFVHANPPALSQPAVRGKSVLSFVEPQLLREGWFHPEVAYCLRSHLRHMLLAIMVEQAANKELPGVVAAVADTAEYKTQLELHEKDLRERGAEVNPVFCYVAPGAYAEVRQQLEVYTQHQAEEKKRRKAAAAAERRAHKSGAERKRDELRQQQLQQQEAAAAETGAEEVGAAEWHARDSKAERKRAELRQQQQQQQAAAVDGAEATAQHTVDFMCLDEQPMAMQPQQPATSQQQQQQQKLPQHIHFSTSDDDDDVVAASPAAAAAAGDAAGSAPAAGGRCRPDAASAGCGYEGDDEDDDFQPSRSKRRSGAGLQQQAKRTKPSPQQQQQQHGHHQHGQRQQQHALHPEQEEDPVLGEQQQQQQQWRQQCSQRRRLQQTGERQRQHPVPDDAGGSASSSDSSGSLDSAGGGAAPGPQQQQAPALPSAGAGADEAEDMSVDEPPLQHEQPATPPPAAQQAAYSAALAPSTHAAAAPLPAAAAAAAGVADADMVDLCSDDDLLPTRPSSKQPSSPAQHRQSRRQQEQQQQRPAGQVSDSDWESAEGSDDGDEAQQSEPDQPSAAQQQPQQQQQQQQSRQKGRQQQGRKDPDAEASELLLPCYTEDPKSMIILSSMLEDNFRQYGSNLGAMVLTDAVPKEHQQAMLNMICEHLDRKRLPLRLLPNLLETIEVLAATAAAQTAAHARTAAEWQQQVPLQQPPAQPLAAGRRSGSSTKGGGHTAAARRPASSRGPAAADKNQRKLSDMLPASNPVQVEFTGQVQPEMIPGAVQRLMERAQEECDVSGEQAGGSEHGGSSEQVVPGLDLQLGTQDEDGAAADAAGCSTLLALLPQQQQQQRQQQSHEDVEVVDISDDEDDDVCEVQPPPPQQPPVAPSPWPATGSAAQQGQKLRARAMQAAVQQQVAGMLGSDGQEGLPAGLAVSQQRQRQSSKQQQQSMAFPHNAMAVGFSSALSQFQNGQLCGSQAGGVPLADCTAKQQQHCGDPSPLPPDVMPYGDSDSVRGGSKQQMQSSGPTESIATACDEGDAALELQEDVTSPTRPPPPRAAAAAAAAAASPGKGKGHGSSIKQPTAEAAALLAGGQLRPTRAVKAAQG